MLASAVIEYIVSFIQGRGIIDFAVKCNGMHRNSEVLWSVKCVCVCECGKEGARNKSKQALRTLYSPYVSRDGYYRLDHF